MRTAGIERDVAADRTDGLARRIGSVVQAVRGDMDEAGDWDLGGLFLRFAITQFTRSLATLLAGGTPLVPSLESVSAALRDIVGVTV